MEDEPILNIDALAADNVRILKIPEESFRKPLAIILVGYPGSGKTYLIEHFKKRFPLVVVTEKEITSFLAPRATILRRGEEKVLLLAVKTIDRLVKMGKSSIYDGNLKRKEQREVVRLTVEAAGGTYILVHISAPKKLCYERVKKLNFDITRGESKGFIMDKDYFEYEIATTQIPSSEENHLTYDGQSGDRLDSLETVIADKLKASK